MIVKKGDNVLLFIPEKIRVQQIHNYSIEVKGLIDFKVININGNVIEGMVNDKKVIVDVNFIEKYYVI